MELSDFDVVRSKDDGIRIEDYRKLYEFAKNQEKTIETHEAYERESRKHISRLNNEKDKLYKIFDYHFGVTPKEFKDYEEFDKEIDGQLKEMWHRIEVLNDCLEIVNKAIEDYLGICSVSYDSWDDYVKAVQAEISKLKAKANKSINDENKTSENGKYESTGVLNAPSKPIKKATEMVDQFNVRELRQIAEHLLVYCNANKEKYNE